MSDIAIRRVEQGDKARWLILWDGYNRFYQRQVEARTTERLWGALVTASGEPFGYMAEWDGQIVGFAHYFFQISTSDWGPRCYMQDLFADPDARGRGVGRALIQAVYAHADAQSAAQTYWLTAADNLTAQRLYDGVAQRTPFIKYMR